MADLWSTQREQALRAVEPLAVRMRPRTLDEMAGQEHILGPGTLLRRMIEGGTLTSVIFSGPPGTGKTTLAEVIARTTDRHFERENAAGIGVERIRQILAEAAQRLGETRRRTILFLDEIHRFSKSQQDVLLRDVERGSISLIGATTENPLFAINAALLSRSTIFQLKTLGVPAIEAVLRRAIGDPVRGYGALSLRVDDEALRVWALKSDGDARRALTALEVAVLSSQQSTASRPPTHAQQEINDAGSVRGSADEPAADGGLGSPGGLGGGVAEKEILVAATIVIDRALAEESIQQKLAVYGADEHYDSASAMIKSVRGSDPDAAIYWIARMLEGGEDPRFIARRLAILASEDIGNADPRGIMVAAACWELVERIGLPEARITLAQCAIYLALAPKSNASYAAIDAALADVREGRTKPVPMHIQDGNVRKVTTMTPGSVKGAAYAYAHTDGARSDSLGMIGLQDYLGVDKRYYTPEGHGAEKLLKERLEEARARRAEGRPGSG